MGSVKTTLDLPEHLVRQVKQRALQQGRPFKDLVAEYIRQGLHALQLEQEALLQEDRRRAGLSA